MNTKAVLNITVKNFEKNNRVEWDSYVHSHPRSTLYHLSGWENVIEKTYGHKTYYLMAVNNSKVKGEKLKEDSATTHELSANINELTPSNKSIQNSKFKINNLSDNVVGILPLVHLKHFLFGNSLVSVPFFDMGGILADNEGIEKSLLNEAVKLGQKLKVKTIELRTHNLFRG